MKYISFQQLNKYRSNTFQSASENRVLSKEQAVEFVNKRGFVYFWPIKGFTLPSLWVAVAGDRPVASAHDDPGHITWNWKDSLLGERKWYYAKVLRKKATIIALDTVPYFYALSRNYGSPGEDYLTQYEQGQLSIEEKIIYEVLFNIGPLDTVTLREKSRLTSKNSDSRFARAMANLQADFKILPVGVVKAGGWRYAFAYEVVPHHYPDLAEKARLIHSNDARMHILRLYIESLGAVKIREIEKQFQWSSDQVEKCIQKLIRNEEILWNIGIGTSTEEWVALVKLIEE